MQLPQGSACTSTDLYADLGSFTAGIYSFGIVVCSDAIPPPPASPCSTTMVGSFVVADASPVGAPAMTFFGLFGLALSLASMAFLTVRRQKTF